MSKPHIAIIAAIDERGALGKGGQLLCRLPNDMARFKQLTLGHTLIMGRRTFESLPNGPLQGRRNIVLSHRPANFPGATTCQSLQDALQRCQEDFSPDLAEIFIIGGAQVYAQALPLAERLYLTRIHHFFPNADAFFPTLNKAWQESENVHHPADPRHPFPYSFLTYTLRK